jgi:polar amino acid transport system substrate-binding protein
MRVAVLLALVSGVAAAIVSATASAGGSGAPPAGAGCKDSVLNPGSLQIGTDNPAYPPWFGGGTPKGSKWKINDPSTGKGFESAVAYAVAGQLGFPRGNVVWVYVPFAKSYAPGPKSFDFDINEVSFTAARASVVDISNSYYDVNQSLVVRKGTPIASVKTIAALKKYKLGVQIGTTSYDYIVKTIKPSHKPAVYDTNDKAVFALKSKRIDGLVVDLPTAFYVSAVQVPNSKIQGYFPNTTANPEHFGLVLQKGSQLTKCVNKALANLKANGTLKRIQQTWLSKVVGVPVLR